MFDRESTASVEAMNSANQRARNAFSVDIVNATIVLLKMESRRFKKQQEQAWKREEPLTPHGEELLKKISDKIDHRDYVIAVTDKGDFFDCIVRRIGHTSYVVKLFKAGGPGDWCYARCTCGAIQKDSVPCHHLVALVKSGKANGVTLLKAMPGWWKTSTWRFQLPENANIYANFDIKYLKDTYPPNNTVRYCPDFVAPNKAGRPRKNMRKKSALEQALEANNKKRKRAAKKSIDMDD